MATETDKRAVFTPATQADADELARNMRPGDRAEIAMWSGLTPPESIRLALSVSETAFAARINGELHCLFGAFTESLIDETAVAWMLCTNAPARHPRAFLSGCAEGFRLLASNLKDAKTLTNFVHSDNKAAVQWLAWAGACFAPSTEDQRGRFGGVFKRFSLNIDDAPRQRRNNHV